MTLTYLGPTVGAGGLIVPAAQEAALDPLLAAAVGLWRASQLPDGWVHADGWGNEGSAGSAIDLIPYDGVSLDGAAAPSTPTLETSGDRGVEAVSADPNNAGDALMFQAGDDASLDMSGSFSFAIDFTPLTVSTDVSSIRFIRKIAGGILELPGFVVENTPPGYGDFAIALTAGTGSTFAVDYNAFILADPSAARHTVVVSVTPTTMKAWLDGVQLTNPFATADLTAVGSPENAQPLYIGVGQRLHNLVWWDDDLTDGEAQSIDALIRAA